MRQLPPQIRSLARLPRGQRLAVIKGQDRGRFMDFYHGILTTTWLGFVARLAALFLVPNHPPRPET